jgi:hypothetical protein
MKFLPKNRFFYLGFENSLYNMIYHLQEYTKKNILTLNFQNRQINNNERIEGLNFKVQKEEGENTLNHYFGNMLKNLKNKERLYICTKLNYFLLNIQYVKNLQILDISIKYPTINFMIFPLCITSLKLNIDACCSDWNFESCDIFMKNLLKYINKLKNIINIQLNGCTKLDKS